MSNNTNKKSPQDRTSRSVSPTPEVSVNYGGNSTSA